MGLRGPHLGPMSGEVLKILIYEMSVKNTLVKQANELIIEQNSPSVNQIREIYATIFILSALYWHFR